jgi:DNA-binding SARP family transcriptional activator
MLSAVEPVPLRFEVLGNVRVTGPNDTNFPLCPRRARQLLALFLLHANAPLNASRLRELLVDGAATLSAPTIRVHVAGLRRCLAPVSCLHTDPDGYRLAVPPGALDLDRFRDLAERGKRSQASGDHANAAQLLGAAAALWPAQPLRDVPPSVALQPLVDALVEEQRIVLEDLTACQLALGRHRELIAELRTRAEASPLHERTWAQLITALHRSGRQAEAYEAYARLRTVLGEEYGAQPGPELQCLYQRILRDEPVAGPDPQAPASVEPSRTDGATLLVPHQLPPPPRLFVGRDDELARLHRSADRGADSPTEIIAVVGPPGVGKSTLAIWFGHQAADRFPDGALYADLHGLDPVEPLDEVLAGFLEALGVAADRQPAGWQARIGLYRSLLTTRRMLVVLDNARDGAQVRPLIPAGPSLVIVTSRTKMSALAVQHGARQITLDRLDEAHAGDYLRACFQDANTTVESAVLAEVVRRCDGLPLALAITAEAVVSRPARSLDLLRRDPDSGLNALTTGDPSCDVRSAFSGSVDDLDDRAIRMFDLIGLHPAGEINCAAVASLAGVPIETARHLLAELTRTHLVEEPTPGRYRMHRLIREYAIERAHEVGDQDRHEAIARALDYYLQNAHTAGRQLVASNQARDPQPPLAGTIIERLEAEPDALEWFNAEHEALMSVLRYAAARDADQTVCALAAPLRTAFRRTGHLQDLISAQRLAAHAAGRIDGNRPDTATTGPRDRLAW